MDFNINKNSTLPVLKLELIQDGRNDYNHLYELIQNANIYFSMTDIITGVKRIGKKLTTVALVEPPSCEGDRYYIIYKFTKKDTSVAGRYVGQFEIDFLDGTGNVLLVPIQEILYVNILDSNIKK